MSIITVPDDYASVVEAYNAAAANDKIYIKESGSPYLEGRILVLKSGIHFQGENNNVRVYTTGSTILFYLKASNTEIDNLHLQSQDGITIYNYANRKNVNIHDCILEVTGSAPQIIVIRTGVGGIITNNTFIGTHTKGIDWGLWDDEVTISNNIFLGATRSHEIVITIAVGSIIHIEGNVMENLGSNNFSSYGITMTGNALSGSYIKNNVITGRCFGTIYGAGRALSIKATGALEITDNKCNGCFQKYTAHLVSGSANINIYHNDFEGGKEGNAFDSGSNNIWNKNSIGNYYGYGGAAYDADGDAIGDDPFLIDGVANNQDDYPLMCTIDKWAECPYLAVKKKWALGRVGVRFVRL